MSYSHLQCHQGTPVFVARAVELGHAVPPPFDSYILPAMPKSPVPYASNHSDRIEKFPFHARILKEPSEDTRNRKWRHEHDHDEKPAFWLLVYWAVRAQPERFQEEFIDCAIWPFLNSVAAILAVDRHWVESSNPRNDPGYVNESFQHLILQFVLNNHGEEFMKHKVAPSPGHPDLTSESENIIPQGKMKRPRINATADETDI